MAERTDYEEDEYERMANYDDLQYEESDCDGNSMYSTRCFSREDEEQWQCYGVEEDRTTSHRSTDWEKEMVFGSRGEYERGGCGYERSIMFREIEQEKVSEDRRFSGDKGYFEDNSTGKENRAAEYNGSLSETVFPRAKGMVSPLSAAAPAPANLYNYGNGEEGYMRSELLYTTEDALFAFNQFKQKLEKELEIAAVQKRVIAKLTRRKLNDLDLNFYDKRIEEVEGDVDEREKVAESIMISDILSQSAQSEEFEPYQAEEDPAPGSDEDLDGNEHSVIASNRGGYIDDVASCSDSSQDDVDEFNDEEKDITGFVTNSSEEGVGKRGARDDIHRLYAEEMEAEEKEEVRRLKRHFKSKVISRKESELEMNWEEDSDGYIPIKEMNLEEEGIVSGDIDLHGGDLVAEDMEVAEDFVVNIEDDELFDMDEDAIARIKREDAGGFSFADLRRL